MGGSDPDDPALGATLASDRTAVAVDGTEPTAAPSSGARPGELARGTQVDKYVVERMLGAGAMGVVYVARDPELDRDVALKLIRPHHDDDGLRVRLYREAQALARVAHPNVVVVHDVGAFGDRVFVAMELVRGTTLRGWLATPRPPREILRVLIDAGRGLAAAHAADLIHRDFKPDNVLIGDDGRARVTDFGLARAADDVDSRSTGSSTPSSPLAHDLTHTGVMVGTPVYAAPEQLVGQGVGPAADQFAFCVTAYEALYGKRPFADARSLDELIDGAATRALPVPPKRPGISKRVAAAITRGLQPRAGDRHPSMERLLAELVAGMQRRRTIAIAGGAAAIGAIGIAVGAIAMGGDGAATCDRGAREVARVWNAGVEANVRQKFATESADRVDRIVARLSNSAATWATMRDDTCRGAGAAGTELTARRTRCLDARLRELVGLVEDVLTPGESLADAFAYPSVMMPVATCWQPPIAASPAQAKEVERIRNELVELENVWFEERRPSSELADLVRRADATGDPSLRAEVLVFAGRVAMTDGDLGRAADLFRKAIAEAETAEHDGIKAFAAAELARTHVRRHEIDEAERVADQAEATIERFGGDERLAAKLAIVRAGIAEARGDAAGALTALESGVALESYDYAALLDLATLYTKLGRTADAATVRARIAADAKRLDDSTAAPMMSALEACHAHFQAGELTAAETECTKAIDAVAASRDDANDPIVAQPIHLLALTYVLLADPAKERPLDLRAAEIAAAAGNHDEKARWLAFAARASVEIGEHDRALELARQSMAIAEKLGTAGDERLTVARATLGRALVGKGDIDAGIRELEWALPRLEVREDTLRVALVLARLSMADALWQRAGRNDRVRARLLVESARDVARAHRASITGSGGLDAAIAADADRVIARVDAWFAKHR
jgi:serine/threonine protein kinase